MTTTTATKIGAQRFLLRCSRVFGPAEPGPGWPLPRPFATPATCRAGSGHASTTSARRTAAPIVKSLALPVERDTMAERIAFGVLALGAGCAVVEMFGLMARLAPNWDSSDAWAARLLS